MAKKPRPLAPPPSPTDEWGIYDPSKAGMEALYSRLGRPVPRAGAGADDADERRRRKRVFRASRPAEGVGMALREARRRADEMSESQRAPFVPAAAPPAPATLTPPAPEPEHPVAVAAVPVKPARAKATKAARRKATAVPEVDAASAVVELPPPAAVAAPAAAAPELPAPKRGGRKAARPKAVAKSATPVAIAAAPAPATPAVPPPSPRRPRGPVPLAAWAHAVSDTERPEPKRHESKGLWRGIFRIPSEVALVEYGRGCRIHRLVIEGGADQVADPF